MIKIENVEVMGWEAAIRGMRNPMNSHKKSDSEFNVSCNICDNVYYDCDTCPVSGMQDVALIGPNDLSLMNKLVKAGTDHRKFMRMITVYIDITAPMYWWTEFDTYKVGTVRNSCSKMHRLMAKPFEMSDFSCDHLDDFNIAHLESLICHLNSMRDMYNLDKNKHYWWQVIQLLPSSYNQKSTVMLNYEVLANMYKSRKNHKLDEWREFCEWIETLPYSKLITGKETKADVR